jgi:aryl-alcohol dehydrogenase-like predicted oxidoreductase
MTQSSPPTTLPAAGAGSVSIGGDLTVHRLGFGAMRLAGPGVWGPPTDRQAAVKVLRRALELGVNFIDTADSYGPDVSEEIIAEALHPYPAGLVIATKGGLTRPASGQWERDAHPAHLRAACEGSLRRLRLNRIDLYQLHAVDPRVPLEESLGELARLQAEGKIRHIGVSNQSLAQLKRSQALVTVVSVQNRYNLADRGAEDVLQYCEREGLAFIPWFPLGAGRDASQAKSAIAWLLARSPIMLPIPGTSSVQHLEVNVAAANLRLTQAQLRVLG